MLAPLITPINPANKSDLKRFVSLERELMKSYPLYVSEIDDDVRKMLTRKTAMASKMEFGLFIATENGVDVARCAAIINEKYQAQKQAGAGFIGFFAAAENCEPAVTAMITEAEQWLKERGVTKVIAPANGGAPNSLGLLVTAFDEEPMFPTVWTPPYYKAYIEKLHYRPAYPLWIYDVDFASDQYKTTKERFAHYDQVAIRTVAKKNWNRDIAILADLINECFVDEWEFAKLSHTEAIEFFGPMKDILAPQQMLFAEADGKPVGFCFALPDLTSLFRSFKGKIGLGAIFKLLTGAAGKFTRAGILGIGVTKAYRGKGLSKAMAIQLYGYHESLGLKRSLYYPVNEINHESRGFAASLGGNGRMMYMVYDKVLE